MSAITAPRAHLVRALEADLIGPFRRVLLGPKGEEGLDSEEILKLLPSRWYLTGFLAPSGGTLGGLVQQGRRIGHLLL